MNELEQRKRILYLLDKIKTANENDPEHGEQALYKSSKSHEKIQTLDDNITRSITPMLEARFNYSALWINAYLDQNWLGLDDIKNYKNDAVLMEWIRLRLENWDHLPPATVKKSCVAIFGYNPYEPEETYLVWPEDLDGEPAVWRYYGADYKFFKNLDSFLTYVAGEKRQDDSGRAQ